MSLSPKLKVLHIGKFYPPHMGGIETHLQALCSQLKTSVDVHALVASDGRRTTTEILDGVPVSRSGTALTLASAPVCLQMSSQIRKAKADLVHLHLPNPTAVLAYLASHDRAPLIITYHSDTVRQKFLGALFQPILQVALRRSAAIIVSSPNYLESSSVLAPHRDKCKVIPLGIRTLDFEKADGPVVDCLRRKHGERTVLTVGRLVYYKGFEYLIRAMTQVRGRLLIIGDGPLRNKLEALARALGIWDRVVFLGEIRGTLAPYYHAADLFVLPSVARAEAFGIVQLEAMACGKPVINTKLPSGVPFVSLDRITGLTVPPANPDALAKAVNLLLDDDGRRKQYGQAARHRVYQEFSLEMMAQKTIQLYDNILESTAAPVRVPARELIQAHGLF
jgi:glycosyltransferase involved in cell wall biosynthesis